MLEGVARSPLVYTEWCKGLYTARWELAAGVVLSLRALMQVLLFS